MKTIAIIGGGAAGLAAAVHAAEVARYWGTPVHVVVYELDERVGRSILRSGNGRCNFSNASITPESACASYWNGAFVSQALSALEQHNMGALLDPEAPETSPDNQVVSLFHRWGLLWRQEEDGRLYPVTNKATTVLDVLRFAADTLGVEIHGQTAIKRLEAPGEGAARNAAVFTLITADGVFERADAVIVACGGEVLRELVPASAGFLPLQPLLGPLAVREKQLVRTLDNIRVRCAVSLLRKSASTPASAETSTAASATSSTAGVNEIIASETGEILFRKYGVSGIAVFNLSRFAQPGDTLAIDLLPELSERDASTLLRNRARRLESQLDTTPTCADVLRGLALEPVAQAAAKTVGLDLSLPCDQRCAGKLAAALKKLALQVEGIGDTKVCQVHRGGVPVAAVDPTTMQLLDTPGLCVVGEALDVDAPCGGFNLHWAFASGMLAAQGLLP